MSSINVSKLMEDNFRLREKIVMLEKDLKQANATIARMLTNYHLEAMRNGGNSATDTLAATQAVLFSADGMDMSQPSSSVMNGATVVDEQQQSMVDASGWQVCGDGTTLWHAHNQMYFDPSTGVYADAQGYRFVRDASHNLIPLVAETSTSTTPVHPLIHIDVAPPPPPAVPDDHVVDDVVHDGSVVAIVSPTPLSVAECLLEHVTADEYEDDDKEERVGACEVMMDMVDVMAVVMDVVDATCADEERPPPPQLTMLPPIDDAHLAMATPSVECIDLSSSSSDSDSCQVVGTSIGHRKRPHRDDTYDRFPAFKTRFEKPADDDDDEDEDDDDGDEEEPYDSDDEVDLDEIEMPPTGVPDHILDAEYSKAHGNDGNEYSAKRAKQIRRRRRQEYSRKRRYPPCVRLMCRTSGHLSIVTITGAKLGRHATNDVVLTETDISRHHAHIVYDAVAKAYMVTDCGTRNGTWLNDSAVKDVAQRLCHNDVLRLGKVGKAVCFSVHIHNGNNTCNGCEPGLFHPTAAALDEDGQAQVPGMSDAAHDAMERSTMHKQRRVEEQRIKKSFGIGTGFETERERLGTVHPSKDRAAQRRKKNAGRDIPGITAPPINGAGFRPPGVQAQPYVAPASINQPIAEGNKGFAMMQKMGWKAGSALGVTNKGILEPIAPIVRGNRDGLGSDNATATMGDSQQLQKMAQQRRQQQRFNRAPLCADMFDDPECQVMKAFTSASSENATQE